MIKKVCQRNHESSEHDQHHPPVPLPSCLLGEPSQHQKEKPQSEDP